MVSEDDEEMMIWVLQMILAMKSKKKIKLNHKMFSNCFHGAKKDAKNTLFKGAFEISVLFELDKA